jgi:hypothetical protein
LADLGLYAPVLLGLFDTASAVSSSERLCRRLPSVALEPCPHEASEPDLAEHLSSELRAERVPVVHFIAREGEDIADRFARVGQICRALDTRKLVLVRRHGGLGRISVINLRTDSATVSKQLNKKDLELLEWIMPLLAEPGRLMVSVTSPLNLLKELFTVKGAGTLVKRGTTIERFASYADIDRVRLTALLEASFGRPLDQRFFDEPPLALYLESDYRGAAILQHSAQGAVLTKFAVEPVAQGEGIAQDLWQALVRDHPAGFWRARPDNPILSWYVTLADGMVRLDKWLVFWRSIDPSRVTDIIAETASKPVDFTA